MRDADYKTDAIIQTYLRSELKGDVTLITVAHRLQTIIDADKVVRHPSSPQTLNASLRKKIRWSWMQVDLYVFLLHIASRLTTRKKKVEFDKPNELLKIENGKFRSLVDESGERDLLYAMASEAAKTKRGGNTMMTVP